MVDSFLVFEVCSASIATRATDLIGIHESDNGRKGGINIIVHIKSIKDIHLFIQLALSLLSLERSDCNAV